MRWRDKGRVADAFPRLAPSEQAAYGVGDALRARRRGLLRRPLL